MAPAASLALTRPYMIMLGYHAFLPWYHVMEAAQSPLLSSSSPGSTGVARSLILALWSPLNMHAGVPLTRSIAPSNGLDFQFYVAIP